MGVLDLRGPEFLALYVSLLGAASLLALLLRDALRQPVPTAGNVDPGSLRLHPLQAAYLAGGPDQAVDATVAALVQRELVAVSPTLRVLSVTKPAPPDLDELERHVHGVISEADTVNGVRRRAGPRFEVLRPRLEQFGLLLSHAEAWKPQLLPTLAVGAVFLLGLAKLVVGVSRGRPVAFLAVLLALTAAEVVWLLARPLWRSRLGDRTLEVLRRRNAALQQTASIRPERIAPADLALAVGLFGATVVQSGPLAPLGYALKPPPQKSDSSAGSCSSGSSGCGGGCGGGGGGCGGCGS